MRSLLLEDFATNIILLPDQELRSPGSKHQKRIRKYQKLIKEISETGCVETAQKLIEIEPIKCIGETKYVSHLRYLQYCINYLRENIRQYEGA